MHRFIKICFSIVLIVLCTLNIIFVGLCLCISQYFGGNTSIKILDFFITLNRNYICISLASICIKFKQVAEKKSQCKILLHGYVLSSMRKISLKSRIML